MILGVDPGAGGALAWLNDKGELLEIEDMPCIVVEVGGKERRRVSAQLLAELLRDITPSHAYVENVGPMKTDGSAGAFAFGKATGMVEGVLAGLSIPMTLVTPQTWKRAHSIPAAKGAARHRACQLFPNHAKLFSRVKDDGRAEAALIGMWGLNHPIQGAASGL